MVPPSPPPAYNPRCLPFLSLSFKRSSHLQPIPPYLFKPTLHQKPLPNLTLPTSENLTIPQGEEGTNNGETLQS